MSPGRSHLDSTTTLLRRIRDGDLEARDQLLRRYLPVLRRWASGRMPSYARSLADTDDLVQVTFLRALDRLKEFEPRREGAFLAYLRRILQNQIKDQIRRAARSGEREDLDQGMRESGPSPLEQAIGQETLELYEKGLARLPERQQVAVFLRVEMGFTYREVAEVVGAPTANAARMLIARALVQVAETFDGR